MFCHVSQCSSLESGARWREVLQFWSIIPPHISSPGPCHDGNSGLVTCVTLSDSTKCYHGYESGIIEGTSLTCSCLWDYREGLVYLSGKWLVNIKQSIFHGVNLNSITEFSLRDSLRHYLGKRQKTYGIWAWTCPFLSVICRRWDWKCFSPVHLLHSPCHSYGYASAGEHFWAQELEYL